MAGHRLAIVIPALNEAATIAEVVERCGTFGLPIVVDDGSSDATAQLAESAGAEVVRLPVNRGYDGALDAGFHRAGELDCPFVVTLDADGQHDPSLLETYIEKLASGVDVVLGVRSRRQRLAEHVFAWFGGAVYGIHDPLCGMKGYRMGVYRKLGHFDSYGSIGTELAIFAKLNGFRCEEVAIPVRERKDAARFDRVFRANVRIFRAMLLSVTKIPRRASAQF